MTEFSPAVDDYWGVADGFRLVVDPDATLDRRVSILRRATGTIVTVSPEIAALIGAPRSEAEVRAALTGERVALHEPDDLFYFREYVKRTLDGALTVRRLSDVDAAAFARFEGAASEQDRDDAYVELDHWAVFGSSDGELLVAAASAYPWRGSLLADIGVLTLPEFRGRRHARNVVRALAAHIVAEGFEPQYRCQLDNAGSIAVAASAGFALFGTWEVVEPEA